MHAAAQKPPGTIDAPSPPRRPRLALVIGGAEQLIAARMDRISPTAPPREFFIQGVTLDGRSFRPSDWAERLAGAMACFRPGGAAGGLGSYIGYSPYCVPTVVNGIKAVVVNEALREIEPMAWDFVMNFARDNHLQVAEACLLPEPPQG